MQHLDLQVISRVLGWLRSGDTVWLCTVLATFGSSPREPGSLLAARRDGCQIGSLSGGCVEEDLLARLRDGVFESPVSVLRYGGQEADGPKVTLPCGGVLEVMIERLVPSAANVAHMEQLHAALLGQGNGVRCVSLQGEQPVFVVDTTPGPRVEKGTESIRVRVGPVQRLVIAGLSSVALVCAEFALALGFEVIVCDPRENCEKNELPGVTFYPLLPSRFIAAGGCHSATAIVALTHDPRLDDLTLMEAVRTPAFYIGAMGSQRTSAQRAERLRRSGGLSNEEIARISMPIGLALGSKTPAEIALAVMADIVRRYRGRSRDDL